MLHPCLTLSTTFSRIHAHFLPFYYNYSLPPPIHALKKHVDRLVLMIYNNTSLIPIILYPESASDIPYVCICICMYVHTQSPV